VNNSFRQRLGVWSIAREHPAHPAILACPSGESLSFSQLAARAHQVVHALRAAGVKAGDTVAIALPNDVDIVVWQLAASEAGWRYYTISPSLPADELATILSHSQATALVAHHDNADACATLPGPAMKITVGGDIPGFTAQHDLLQGHPDDLPSDRCAGAQLVYSSGTTGAKKAIEHPPPRAGPDEVADAMKTFGQAFQFEPLTGAHLVSAGMHHAGARAFYIGALHVGQPLVIMAKFDAEQTLRLIEDFAVGTAYMVPTQFVRLLRLPDQTRHRYNLSSLRSVVHSAAPCPRDIKQQMLDWWGPVIWETYGGTEGAATIAKPWRWIQKPGTVGRPIKGMTVRILDEDGQDLPPNTTGLVYLEPDEGGFNYYRDTEQTAQAYRGRSFTIGDIGYLDDDGYLFIVDRQKDMIITGGVNVYPAEVEAVLLSHPSVADVAVIGLPDPEWGESVCAFVTPLDTVAPSDELIQELTKLARSKLDSYKCPRTIRFRNDLPRTETGKLLKRHLRDELQETSASDPTG
jgi:long-chain acyl-CoA synthetase